MTTILSKDRNHPAEATSKIFDCLAVAEVCGNYDKPDATLRLGIPDRPDRPRSMEKLAHRSYGKSP